MTKHNAIVTPFVGVWNSRDPTSVLVGVHIQNEADREMIA